MIIKICGITSIAVAQAAKEAGADLLGFVFAESKRQIPVKEAIKIGQQVKGIGKVGVFVNKSLQEVQEIAQCCKLDFVQLHGEESPEYCRLVGRPIIKAFRVGPEFVIERCKEYPVSWMLLDSFSPGQYGGTGKTFDWQSMKSLSRQVTLPVMVAGGLTPENIALAIQTMTPKGIDVSGGVETNGNKDLDKIQQFIIAARKAERGNVTC
ncbi:phosphoribosylanthranilate isomerase [Pelosinus sp. IPA-1]|uniref:phosphoribosylanthranilate isomerase n=1 Tax=Pelosinus sp. IPA-1 TaxID=3029569 RepID=UPI0024362357|nr:phosphoribosylanthranilate isomerase [Pelosinus sp. IPA-1]GMB00740.1 N-(5'-phosphoribosyl)anthranilate isomerase [Pelosinus sp. IPA-1]